MRFLPRGLFSTEKIRGWRPEKPKPPVFLTGEDRYGDDRTIHHTGHVDVEIGPDDEVCAVWFRCRLLPFKSSRVVDGRVSDMTVAQAVTTPIKAIVFVTDFPDDEGTHE